MICKIGNLGLDGRYGISGCHAVFVQKTLNWRDFCGGGCSFEQYYFDPLKNFLDAFILRAKNRHNGAFCALDLFSSIPLRSIYASRN